MTESGLVAILFTDLVGSTEMAADLGDVAADDVRRQHFAHLREAIAASGGTEVKTIGDAVMVAYKGAADAVVGAVAMQRAVDRHNRSLDGHPLSMRVGVSVGDATLEDGDWFGTPVVEASRLCHDAAGGQILVSELVRALAGSRCEFPIESLGTRELKGLPAPVAVCTVDWEVPHDTTRIPLPGFVDVAPGFAFAGRADAYEVLHTAWKEASEGARRAVLVSGEPGVGKTRLVTELVRAAHDAGTTVLWGRCDEELGSPFEPFAEALRHYANHAPLDRLRAELGPLGGELGRLLPDLAARVPGLAAPVAADPDTERHRLFEAVTDLLAGLSAGGPVILVLDDVHWSDKPSLLLFRHLLRSAEAVRLLILATYRDTDLDRTHPLADVLADLRREPGVTRLDLDGLDEGEVIALMEAAAGHDLDAPGLQLARALQRETQGNPFFVGEVLRHLAESGTIVQRDGMWTSDRTLEEVGIPEGIREVVGRRLSRLSDAANRALALAAVIGAEFDLVTIEAAGGPAGDDLFDALDQAVQHSIIREVPNAVGRYAFAHALVRSALYEELTTNRRVRMHWQVGLALEARFARRLDDHVDELAHHFTEGALAGDPMKAVEYSGRAGHKAFEELAFESAARHFESALSTLDLIAGASPAERCDLQIALATALHHADDEHRRAAAFEAVAAARATGDAQRLATAAMIPCTSSGSTDSQLDHELVAVLEEALAAVDDGAPAMRARLLSALAVELQWGPEVERRMRLAGEALELARATRDPEALSLVLTRSWALMDCSTPKVDDLERLFAEAEAVAREHELPARVADALRVRGYMAACRGDGAAFEAHHEAASRIVDGLRRPGLAWLAHNDAAARAAFFGGLARGEQLAVEAVALGQAAHRSEESILGFFGAILYQLRTAQGRVGELVPILEARVAASPGVPVWRVALGGALTEDDRLDEAMTHHLWLAEDGCRNVPRDVEFPVILCGLGRQSYRLRPPAPVVEDVYQRLLPFTGLFNWTGPSVGDPNDFGLALAAATLGREDDSDRHFAAAIELCERAGARAYLARCHHGWAMVLAERGDGDRARAQATAAIAIGEEIGMTGPQGVVPRSKAILESL